MTEFWVKWRSAENLLTSSKNERHYEMDKVSGKIEFGDGIYGKIPPVGTDNIKADYRTGGGSKGNLAAYEIKDLKTSIPFVDKAFNPLAPSGGSQIEAIERTRQRGPKILKHRNRAIAAEDFEHIAYQSSRTVAKAKCIPNLDSQREFKPGWVTVVVIPQAKEDRPELSLQLKRKVENYLKERSVSTLADKSHLYVSGPAYWDVSVNTTIISVSIDVIPIVEKNIFSELKEFLHPLSGGQFCEGWDFGRLPCLSDFYALLERMDGVDHVESLSLNLRTCAEGETKSGFLLTSGGPADIEMPPYAVVCNGQHKITVTHKATETESLSNALTHSESG